MYVCRCESRYIFVLVSLEAGRVWFCEAVFAGACDCPKESSENSSSVLWKIYAHSS